MNVPIRRTDLPVVYINHNKSCIPFSSHGCANLSGIRDNLFSFSNTTKKKQIKTPEKQTSNETGDLNILNPDVYRSGVGSLLYAAATTRPDISNIVKNLSRRMDGAENKHMHAMYRVMQYLLNTNTLGIIYDQKNGIEMEAYADSDYVK